MQVTMQHALKLFWRPKAIELEDDGVMTYEKVEIIRRNDGSIRFNGSDSNLLIVFYVQIMPDDLVMQLHRF